jgi:hypothetical protein
VFALHALMLAFRFIMMNPTFCLQGLYTLRIILLVAMIFQKLCADLQMHMIMPICKLFLYLPDTNLVKFQNVKDNGMHRTDMNA